MKIICIDDVVLFTVSAAQAADIRRWVDSGYVIDAKGQRVAWRDRLDCEGNLCLDTDAFDTVHTMLRVMA